MDATRPLVELRNVWKTFDRKPVLRGIDLALARGTILAVMGGSGTGKTVLLRIASGLIYPDSGAVSLFGVRIDRLSEEAMLPVRRRSGFVFQGAALFDSLTVFENVAFPLREHTDLPERLIRELVLTKLHAVGLRGAAGLMPAELSGGMGRRVALARAMVMDPKMLIYDEPFAGLDPISLGVVLRLIRQMNDALGITSIVVSHDVHEINNVADDTYLLSGGEVVASGTPKELQRSQSGVVRQFMEGLADGPVPFHYPAPDYAAQLLAREDE
jgi:phospholipid/cholesterol/gamma-HCH transport system ATP-binding protein